MKVIGTAGHVDHGKSTLIAALTGTHPDRLKEEQDREMTIELGFGWFTLPNDEEVGIIDVPGHRDFIENMLAGIGGIDAVLLVIAADEGIMPQTKEHLAILNLLQIPTGLIVLTKIDLASDSGWLDLLEADIRHAVKDTVLKDSPVVRVSAKNKTGLDELISNLQIILQQKPTRADLGRPRLPIDRVFTMSGFGTVVTGTLSDGKLSVGDEVEILPSNQKGRIRGLQTHKQKEETARPGSRTAVNISGVEIEAIRRGNVIVHPGQYQVTQRIDAVFHLMEDLQSPLKHATEVKFFAGASEAIATLRLLGKEELLPGEDGWIQLELREPVLVVRGDRYILRRPSPGETLGGGKVLDAHPKSRHKRFDENILKSLESLAQGAPSDILLEAALALGSSSVKDIFARSRLEMSVAESALKELIDEKLIISLEENTQGVSSNSIVITSVHLNDLQNKLNKIVGAYHASYQLRRGMLREELKSRLDLSAKVFNLLISYFASQGLVKEDNRFVALSGHKVKFNGQEQAKVQALMRKFESNPFSPPTVKDCLAEVDQELLNALIEMDELVQVSQDIVFKKNNYKAMVKKINEVLEKNNSITLAEVRDLFNTSRKYAQAFLEHLDSIGLTIREGDLRKRKL